MKYKGWIIADYKDKEFLEKAKTRRLIINGYLKHRLSLA